MIFSPARHIFPLLLFLLTVPTAPFLTGQVFPEDVRVSHSLPQPTLPEDAEIQAADRIGERVLVVWGSSRTPDADSAANTLYWQLLVNGVKAGEPARLTDDRFDPSGYVQVIALDAGFLVLWNDRHNGRSHTWTTFINAAGGVREPEMLWAGPPVATEGVRRILLDNGHFLIWNDTAQKRILGRRVGPTGVFFPGQEIVVGNGVGTGVLADLPIPGESLILRDSLAPVLVGVGGSLTMLPERAAEKFVSNYHIGPDGSLLAYRSDTIWEFRTVYDTVPQRGLSTVSAFQMSSKGVYRIAGSEIIGRNDSGDIQIIYSIHPYARDPFDYASNSIWYGRYKSVEHDSSRFAPPVLLERSTLISGHMYNYFIAPDFSIDRERTCDGYTYRLYRIAYTHAYWSTTVGWQSWKATGWLNEVVHNEDTVRYDLIKDSTAARHQFDASLCVRQDLPLRRIKNPYRSQVAVEVDSIESIVSVPLGTSLVRLPHRFPHLIPHGSSLALSSTVFGLDTILLAEIWDGNPIEMPSHFSDLSLKSSDSTPRSALQIMPYNLDGASLVHLFFARTVQSDSGKNSVQSYSALFLLTDTGWRNLVVAEPVDKSRFYSVLSVACDPDDGGILVASGWLPHLNGNASADSISVAAFSKNGEKLWQIDSLRIGPIGFHLLPLDGIRFAAIGFDKRIYRFEGDSLVKTSSPLPTLSGQYLPYYYESFVWISPVDAGVLHIEQRDADGVLLREGELRVRSVTAGRRLYRNPVDSGVVLLYTRPVDAQAQQGGIAVGVFDQTLSLIDTLQISATRSGVAAPSGTFRGDTLYVVWEDYRDGIAEIYANAVVPSVPDTATGVDEREEGAEAVTLSISPNPARDLIGVRIGGQVPDDGEIELVDALGNRLRAEPVARNSRRAVLDGRSLAPGLYFVRLRSAGNVTIAKVIVR